MHHPAHRAYRLLALLSFLSLAACAGGEADAASRVVRTDSAGVELVDNHTADRPLAWTPEPLATIGDLEGPTAFGSLHAHGIAIAPSGEIHVLDAQSHTVHVVTEDGTPVRRYGRRGGGPGEFEFAYAVALEPDGTAGVFAYDKQGLVRFDAAGRPLTERKLADRPSGLIRFVAGKLTYVAAADEEGAMEVLVAVSEEGTDTLAAGPSLRPAMFQLPRCAIHVNLPPLLSPRVVWNTSGDLIAASHGTGYSVDVWRDGAVVRRVRRALPPLAGTAVVAAAENADTFRILAGPHECRISPEEMAEAQGYASVAPHVAAVAVAPDGGLWVRRRTAEGTRPVDVFGPDGSYRGTLPPDSPWPVAFLDAERMVAIERDELEVPRLVVYRTPPND